jgi:hypothetical protein
VSYNTQTPRKHPLILGVRMNFLPLTEPKPTDNLERAVSQRIDAVKSMMMMMMMIMMMIIIIIIIIIIT